MESVAPILEEEMECEDRTLVPVRIAEFYSPKTVILDLFLKLGTGRYLRIFRAGEPYNEAGLRAYEADRGVRQVYFERDKRPQYVANSLALLQKILPVSAVPVKTKFGVARILSELYLQELFECDDQARPALVEKGKEICGHLAAWIETESRLEAYLLRIEQVDATNEAHAFLVGLLAGTISKRFPWKSRRTTETILLSAFFSDIGIYKLPPEVARLKPKRMKADQRREYHTHPEISFQLLKQCGSVSEQILNIVREHHEYCDGTGFPHKLTVNKILQLSKLLMIVADIMRAASDNLLPPLEALKILFPLRTPRVFSDHPELVAKYEREMLMSVFDVITSVESGGGT